MEHTIGCFRNRMQSDREFRKKMLAAWKSGKLVDALLEEGYSFSLEELNISLPQIRTGIRAGACGKCSAGCHGYIRQRRKKYPRT